MRCLIRAVCALTVMAAVGPAQLVPMRVGDPGASVTAARRRQPVAGGAPPFAEVDALGRTRVVAGILSPARTGSARDAANAFVESDLSGGRRHVVTASSEWDGLRAVRFRTEVDGVRVYGGETVLLLDAQNRVLQVARDTHGDLIEAGGWPLEPARAFESVAAHRRQLWPAEIGMRASGAERIWFPQGDRLTPAYRWTIEVAKPAGGWEYVVDARSGGILKERDLVHRADANVFVRNPVQDRGQLERVSLPNLGGGGFLTGEFARIFSSVPAIRGQVAPNTVVQLAQADAQGNFVYSTEELRFDEAQLYWGIDRAHARFRALGFDGLDRPVDGVVYFPDAFKGGPFFNPASFSGRGGIFFAPSGPRDIDLTWDVDVIFHEYTHAVVNAVIGDEQSLEFGALNEGYGDYFSNSFQNDPNTGEFGVQAFLPGLPYLRTSENAARYPRDYVTEVHSGSLIWSGALWDLRKRMGAERADRIALGALLGMRGSAGYFVAAVSAATAARALYGDAARDEVINVMAGRGIFSNEGLAAFQASDIGDGQPRTGQLDAASATSCLLDDANQYRVEVPANGSTLSVAMAAQATAQLFIRYRRPVAVVNNQAQAEYRSERGTQVRGSITAQSTPELQAGIYYLAVANCTESAQRYQVAAAVETLGERQPIPLVALASGQAVTGSMPPGPLMNARQFSIRVPQGATTLRVSLEGSADVDLYASFGQPVLPTDIGVPLSDSFAATGGNTESLTISRLTKPALQAGTYYFSVFNRDENQLARFTLTATVSSEAVADTRVIALTAGAATRATVGAAAPGSGVLGAQQYSIAVPAGATRLTVNAASSNDVLVFVRARTAIEIRDGEPLFDFVLAPSRRPRLEITPASFPALAVNATYYIAVANFSASAAEVTLTAETGSPGGGGGSAAGGPSIPAGGVVNGASFRAGISGGSWVTIQGENLSDSTRIWMGSDFAGTRLPTQLDGVSVTINGRAAYVYFISPRQLNVLAPDDPATGTVEVRVTNSRGVTVTQAQKSRVTPALFVFDPDGRRYAAAVHADGTFVGRPGLFPGLTTRGVRAGDSISFFGSGFGPVEGAPDSGVILPSVARLLGTLTVRIGGRPAGVTFAGMVSNGLFQINVVAPGGLSGDQAVEMAVDGVPAQTGVFITLQP
ncbi:MAG: IPT/TIG domain-containing protein [Bryobacteraceae bacterium]